MSRIKKYKPGGTFVDEVNEYFDNNKFSKGTKQQLISDAENFEILRKAEEEAGNKDFLSAFSAGIDRKVTVDRNKLKSDVGKQINFNPNTGGNILNLYLNYAAKTKPQEVQSSVKTQYGIENPFEFGKRAGLVTKEGFSGLTREQKEATATKLYSNYIKEYAQKIANKTPDQEYWGENIIGEHLALANNPNLTYQDIVPKLQGMAGWEPTNFMLSKEDLEQEAIKLKAKADEDQAIVSQKEKEAFNNKLKTLKFNPEQYGALWEQGYKNFVDPTNIPTGFSQIPPDELTKILGEGYSIVYDDAGRGKLINPNSNSLVDYRWNNPFSKNYGNYLSHDAQGNLVYYDSKTKGYQAPVDEANGQNLRKFAGTIQGYEGKNIYGFPTKNTDGTYNYTNKIIVKEQQGENEVVTDELTREGDYFVNSDKTRKIPLESINVSGYDNTYTTKDDYFNMSSMLENKEDLFNKISAGRLSEGPIQEHLKSLEQYVNLPNADKTNEEKTKAIIGLKSIITNPSASYLEKDKATKLYQKLITDFNSDQEGINRIENLYNRSLKVPKFRFNSPLGPIVFKEGGIVKYQNGKKISSNEYLAKYGGKKLETPTEKSNNIRGTLRDMNTADKVSLGASVASFIPVIGGAAGLVATGADIVSDYQKGKNFDVGNFAANLGFVGLGLVGLGGLKLGAKAAKVGKATIKTIENTSHSKILNVLSKAANAGEEGKLSLKALGVEAKEIKTLKDLKVLPEEVKNIGSSISKSNLTKIKELATSKIKELENVPSSKLADAPEKIAEAQSKVSKMLSKSKSYGNYIAPAVLGASGLSSAVSMVGDASEKGIMGIQEDDLKTAVLTGAGAKAMIKNLRRLSDIKKLSNVANVAKGDTKEVVNVQGKSFNIEPTKDAKKLVSELDNLKNPTTPLQNLTSKVSTKTKTEVDEAKTKKFTEFSNKIKELLGEKNAEKLDVEKLFNKKGKLTVKELTKEVKMSPNRKKRAEQGFTNVL